MIPHRLEFDEGARYCDKISGRLASYVTREEFEEIVYHLSLTENMQAQPCVKSGDREGTKMIEVYLAGTDEDTEGTWTTLYSRERIEVHRRVVLIVYSLCTHCVLIVYSCCTHCVLIMHSLSTYLLSTHFTHCIIMLYSLCTHCVLIVLIVYSSCTH